MRRSKTDRAERAQAAADSAARAGAAGGVLVVNDDEDACELLCRVVQRTGAVAFRAHSADGALEELSEHQASIGAVILDFGSGMVTSFSVLERIRERPELGDPAVLCIATTNANRTLAFDEGFDEFVTRPFHVDDLAAAVASMLARSPEERESYRQQQSVAGRGLTDLHD